jgi:hypothetical protein
MPTLRAEIIAAQKDDEGMGHIKRRMRGCERDSMVQGKTGSAKERSFEEEDSR